MNNSIRFSMFATLTGIALLASASESRADIEEAFINDEGNLELTFVADAPALRSFDYRGSAKVVATYVCATESFVESDESQMASDILEHTERIPVDYGGRVRGVLLLKIPEGTVNMVCKGSAPRIASVTYTNIEVTGELGDHHDALDVTRNFIALP